MYAVYVEFHLRVEFRDEFIDRVCANAKASLEKEQGCLQFDVCEKDGEQSVIWLYELYTSRADFDLHLASSHFKEFSSEVESMVLKKVILSGGRLTSS